MLLRLLHCSLAVTRGMDGPAHQENAQCVQWLVQHWLIEVASSLAQSSYQEPFAVSQEVA